MEVSIIVEKATGRIVILEDVSPFWEEIVEKVANNLTWLREKM